MTRHTSLNLVMMGRQGPVTLRNSGISHRNWLYIIQRHVLHHANYFKFMH